MSGMIDNTLMNIGENPTLQLTSYQLPPLEEELEDELPTMMPLIGTLPVMPASVPFYGNTSDSFGLPTLPHDHHMYTTYQHGQMLVIGVENEYWYHCEHLGRQCQAYFWDPESLLVHFATRHFAFTRITPADRYRCSDCKSFNPHHGGGCLGCGTWQEAFERVICGNYIREHSHYSHPPSSYGIFLNSLSSSQFIVPESSESDLTDTLYPGGGMQTDVGILGPYNLLNSHFDDAIDPNLSDQGYDFDTTPYGGQNPGGSTFNSTPFNSTYSHAAQAYLQHRLVHNYHHRRVLLALFRLLSILLAVLIPWLTSEPTSPQFTAPIDFSNHRYIIGFSFTLFLLSYVARWVAHYNYLRRTRFARSMKSDEIPLRLILLRRDPRKLARCPLHALKSTKVTVYGRDTMVEYLGRAGKL